MRFNIKIMRFDRQDGMDRILLPTSMRSFGRSVNRCAMDKRPMICFH